MKYQIELIKSTLELASIATAAGVSSMSNRVFVKIGEEENTGSLNVGRMPYIHIKQVSVNYEFQTEPDHGGSRSSTFIIRIITPSFINRGDTQYKLLEKIKVAVLSALTKETKLGVTNISEYEPKIIQGYILMDIGLTCDTSYNSDYSEGT